VVDADGTKGPDRAPAKKAAAAKAPAKKAVAVKPPPAKSTSAPAAPVAERSWASPHASTLSLPDPQPGVPIKREHVAAGSAAVLGLLLLKRRRKRRRGK
jgi:hypothetical protein